MSVVSGLARAVPPRLVGRAAALMLAAALGACGQDSGAPGAAAPDQFDSATAADAPGRDDAADVGDAPVILVMGDSLSAAYGIPRDRGWVALLGQRLDARDAPHRIVNASISGETTAGGKRRLPALLDAHKPALTIIELGANDGLRGQPIANMRANLLAMGRRAQAAGSDVLILGMRIPPNYGQDYTEQFHATFADVAKTLDARAVPFFLEPIALDPVQFQDDGIHPTAAAQPALLDHVWPAVEAALP